MSEATRTLRYWLDNAPTSNSDRYALEQAARAVLTELHTALSERNALWAAAWALVQLKDGPRDAEHHEAKDDAWEHLRAALRSTKATQDTQHHTP